MEHIQIDQQYQPFSRNSNISMLDISGDFSQNNILSILNVIKDNLKNTELLNDVIYEIFSLSSNENNRNILIYNGSCETIIDVIEYHKSNIELVENCCKVLIWFLNNEDGVLCIKRKLSTLNNDNKFMITNMIKNICTQES